MQERQEFLGELGTLTQPQSAAIAPPIPSGPSIYGNVILLRMLQSLPAMPRSSNDARDAVYVVRARQLRQGLRRRGRQWLGTATQVALNTYFNSHPVATTRSSAVPTQFGGFCTEMLDLADSCHLDILADMYEFVVRRYQSRSTSTPFSRAHRRLMLKEERLGCVTRAGTVHWRAAGYIPKVRRRRKQSHF